MNTYGVLTAKEKRWTSMQVFKLTYQMGTITWKKDNGITEYNLYEWHY